MATTTKEPCNEVCLLILLNTNASQLDRCRLGECSAWEWDLASEEGDARRGHCALAGRIAASRNTRKR